MSTSNWQQDICKYIENYAESECDGILRKNEEFDFFYYLSENRKGILYWYDFIENASVLEIGGGYGAVTSLFCEKCREVTITEKNVERAGLIDKRLREYDNVTVLSGDFFADEVQKAIKGKKYDYIVLLGLLEVQSDPISYLQALKKYLTQNGKLLLAVDNPYGAHFLAGGTHPLGKGKPFEAVNGWGRRHFTRQQIIEVIEDAGFSAWKLFYPMPDYHFTQVVYSDAYLPQTKLSERIQVCNRDNSTLVANEKRILDAAVTNNAFPFVANSFLIECSMDEEVSKVNYAAVTLERNEKHSCITKIYDNETVTKEAVHKEGIPNIERVAVNLMDLREHGMETVESEYKNGIVKMSFCKAPLLSSILDDFILQGKEAFIALFEELYENILHSSEVVDDNKNPLLTEDNRKWDWGPILKKCYFEMIPMNCFYDNGRFIYFDQEFVKDNFPAKYTLYRALRNTYIFNPNAGKCVPLDEMKAHFQMEQIWDVLEKEDDLFLESIRKENNPLFRWTKIDNEKIKTNQQLLQK